MWLVCGALGIFIGAAVQGWEGGMVGAILGGVAGGLLRAMLGSIVAERAKQSETRIEHIYKALGDIHFRLKALEDNGAVSPMEAAALKAEAEKVQAQADAARQASAHAAEP